MGSEASAWDEFGADVFLGYEYRLCIKRADTGPGDGLAAAFQRAVSTFARWADVPPPDRLWYWRPTRTKHVATWDCFCRQRSGLSASESAQARGSRHAQCRRTRR